MTDSLDLYSRDLQRRIALSEAGGFPGWTDEEFNRWAGRLFRMQCQFNLPYGAWCRSLGIEPNAPDDWRAIPAVPTEAFKQFELSALPPEGRRRFFQSSGTTGAQASRHFHSDASLELYQASFLPWFGRHFAEDDGNARARRTFVSLTPPPRECPRSSLVHMISGVMAQFGSRDSTFVGVLDPDGGWGIDWTRLPEILECSLPGKRPLLLLGTAFNYVHLIDELDRRGISLRLDPSSAAMETGGYKGRSRVVSKPDLHAGLRHRLGLGDGAVVTEYGTCELGSQAYDGMVGTAHSRTKSTRNLHFPPWCRTSVVSPESGQEVGEGIEGWLKVVDLANAWSVAAVQTGDIARRVAGGFELMGRAVDMEARGCSLMVTAG